MLELTGNEYVTFNYYTLYYTNFDHTYEYNNYLPISTSGLVVRPPLLWSSEPKPFHHPIIALLKEMLHTLFELLFHSCSFVFSWDEAINSQWRTCGKLRIRTGFDPVSEGVLDYGCNKYQTQMNNLRILEFKLLAVFFDYVHLSFLWRTTNTTNVT